jgi:hypothetical protein
MIDEKMIEAAARHDYAVRTAALLRDFNQDAPSWENAPESLQRICRTHTRALLEAAFDAWSPWQDIDTLKYDSRLVLLRLSNGDVVIAPANPPTPASKRDRLAAVHAGDWPSIGYTPTQWMDIPKYETPAHE